MFYKVVRAILKPLSYLLFWPILKGRENLPTTGPAILAANHLGAGETFLLVVLVPQPITFPAKQELFRRDSFFRRLFAWVLRMMRQVPMDRSGGDASVGALGSVYEVLEKHGYVAILPEGHRSPDGRLYKGRTGVARLALAAGVPVIPVGCFRTRFVRKWLPWPWLYRPELRIGLPFSFPEEMRQRFLTAPDYDAAHAVLREATDQVMVHIQAITGQEIVDQYSYQPKAVRGGH